MADGKWKITGTTATYFNEEGKQVAKLTGLKSGLADSALDSVVGNAEEGTGVSEIKLGDDLVGTSKVTLTLSNGGKYKLVYDGSEKATFSGITSTVASGKVTIKGKVTEGWVQTNDKTLTKVADKTTPVTLATISGLNKNLDEIDGKIGLPVAEGETFSEAIDVEASTGKVTLKGDALGTAKITLSSSYGYTLALDEANNEGVVGGEEGTEYWTVSGTTATYKQDTSAKFVLAADAKSVAYTAKSTATIATIKGLAKDLKDSFVAGENSNPASIAGIEVTDPADSAKGEIKLSKNVLATTNGTATLTLGTAYKDKYQLALNTKDDDDGKVPEEAENKNIWVVSGTTATYKAVQTAHYKLDATKLKITSVAQSSGTTLATVSGLKSGLIAKDDGLWLKATGEGEDTKVIEAVAADATTSDPPTPAKIKILSADALNNKTVSITAGDYQLEIDDSNNIKEPEVNAEWEFSGTTASYKGSVEAGYTLSDDGKKLTYSAAKSNATVVSITGIVKATDANKDALKAAITLGKTDNDAKTIYIGAAALGTSDIKIGSGTGYTLAFANNLDAIEFTDTSKPKVLYKNNLIEDIEQGDKYDEKAIEEGVEVWRISGNTATYKKIIPEYYTVEDGKIVYHKEADFKDENDKAVVLATVTGLRSGIKAENLDSLISIGNVEDNDGKKIIIKKDALGTGTVKINEADTTYQLAFDETAEGDEVVAEPKLDANSGTWSVTKVAKSGTTPASTTATLKGKISAGYTLKDNQILYSPAQTNGTVVTVTGLKDGLKASDLNGDNALISYDPEATVESGELGETVKQIKIKNDALGTTDVATDDGFELALGDDVLTEDNSEVTTGANTWFEKSGEAGTYEYKLYKSDYYEIEDKKIVHKAESIGDVLATVTGLKSGLQNKADAIESGTVAESTLVEDATDANATALVSVEDKAVTVNEGALDAKDVELTGDGYTLALGKQADGDTIASSSDELVAEIDGTTLTVKKVTTAGYEQENDSNNKKIIYTPDNPGAVVAEVSGLAENLVVCDDNDDSSNKGKIGYYGSDDSFVEVLTISALDETDTENKNKITILSRDALGAGDVTIADGGEYTFVLSTGGDVNFAAADATDRAWILDENDATKAYLVSYQTAGYALKTNGKTIEYTPADFNDPESAFATLEGLKKGVTPSAVDGKIDGIDIDDGVVTLSEKVLGDNDITFTALKKDGDTTEYSLTPAGNGAEGAVPKPANNPEWTFNNGTATYTETKTKGWEMVESDEEEEPSVDPDNSGEPAAETPKVYMAKFTAGGEIKSSITGLANLTVVTENDIDDSDSNNELTTNDIGKIGIITKTTTGEGQEATTTTTFSEAIVASDDGEGNITFVLNDNSAFAKKNVVLNNQRDVNYKLELTETAAAKAEEAVWTKGKSETKAVYKQDVAAGHTQINDTTLSYSGTKKTYTLATITGLKSGEEFMAEAGLIPGIEVTTDENGKDVIVLAKEILGKTNVTVDKNSKYNIALDGAEEDYAVADDEAHLIYDAKNGKLLLVEGKTEGWAFKQTAGADTADNPEDDEYDYKTLVYTKANHDTLATVSGLKKNIEVDGDGNILDENVTVSFIKNTEEEKDGEDKVITEAEDGTIILGAGILDTMKVTLGNNDKYTFAFNAEEEEGILPTSYENGIKVWSADGKGTAKYQYDVKAGHTIADDGKSITYSKAKTEVLAELKGLSNDVTTITKEETLSNGRKTLENAPIDAEAFFEKFGIMVTDPDFDEDGNIITSGAITVMNATTKETVDDTESGTTEDVTRNVLAGKGVSITSTNYALAVDEELNPKDFEEPKWYYGSGTGTATLKNGKTAGYELDNNSGNIVYKPEATNDTLATIKGLSKDIKIGGKSDSIYSVDDSDHTLKSESAEGKLGYIEKNQEFNVTVEGEAKTVKKNHFQEVSAGIGFELLEENEAGKTEGIISLPEDFFRNSTTNIEVTSGDNYSFTFEDIPEVVDEQTPDEFKRNPVSDKPLWSGNGGTLNLIQHTSAGYSLESSGSVFTYSKEKPASSTVVAKITGLNASLRASTTKDIDASNESGTASMQAAGVLGYMDKKDFTIDEKTVTKNAFFAYDDNDNPAPISFDEDTKTITLKQGALNAKDLAVSGTAGYKFELYDNIKQYAEEATEWVVNGTTAVYKNYEREYYTYGTKKVGDEDVTDATAIKYTKPQDIATYLTVTGLKSGLALDTEGDGTALYQETETETAAVTFDRENKKVMVSADALGTAKVSLKGGEYTDYTLAFAQGFETNESATLKGRAAEPVGELSTLITAEDGNTSLGWQKANSSGTASLKGAITAGYTLANDGKSITYASVASGNKLVAQITGLKSGAEFTDNAGVIELSGGDGGQLTNKSVAITTNMGDVDYTLKLADGTDSPTVEVNEETPWSIKSGAATLKGTATAGYTLAKSRKSIAYTAAITTAGGGALATIKGVKTDAEFTAPTENTIELSGENLDSKVSIGSDFFAYSFDNTYNKASITGSAKNDSLAVAGSGVSVNAGKGDDDISFGNTEGGNYFIYASGDGNDVIADFTDKDMIKINSVAITEDNITKDGEDVVIKVGTGSIKLDNFASGTKINIIDKSGTKASYDVPTEANNLLIADDNYIAPTQDLSAIVSNRIGQIYSGENFASQDITSLAKQSEVIAYSDKK